MSERNTTALVIGAGGGIGSALLNRWRSDPGIDRVIGVSRAVIPDDPDADDALSCFQSDYSTGSIEAVCAQLGDSDITRVCICNGILHNDNVWPDKRIEDIDIDSLLELYTVNTVIPMLWLRALLPVIKSKRDCCVAAFSARIGSIGDNGLGGWYGYRASKAALNMMLKTAAIEFSRRAKNVKLVAFHPGTVDTPLSRPFQANIQYEILSPEHVADSLATIMNEARPDGELSYVDWENKPIAW